MDDLELIEGFLIDNDGKANWAIEKIKENEAEAERLIKIANDKKAEIDLQIKEIQDKCQDDSKWLKGKLRQYFETVQHKETKTQETYKLLDGSLVMKKASQKLTKVDDEAMVNWLLESGNYDFVETKEVSKVKWADFKKTLSITENGVVTESGELVPESVVSIEDVPEDFNIK